MPFLKVAISFYNKRERNLETCPSLELFFTQQEVATKMVDLGSK